MRLYALAALLALPLFGLASQSAKADYYCCGGGHKPYDFVTHKFYVATDAVVFGCDGYHCETNVRLRSDIEIKARCRNGWCEVRSFPFKNAWVLERCLKRLDYDHEGYPDHSSLPYEPYDVAPEYDRRPY